MEFTDFAEAVATELTRLKARIDQRYEDSDGTSWWISFTHAACLYRILSDRRSGSMMLEKGQGSFVPNRPTTWRVLESQPQPDPGFEGALDLAGELLARFRKPTAASAP